MLASEVVSQVTVLFVYQSIQNYYQYNKSHDDLPAKLLARSQFSSSISPSQSLSSPSPIVCVVIEQT